MDEVVPWTHAVAGGIDDTGGHLASGTSPAGKGMVAQHRAASRGWAEIMTGSLAARHDVSHWVPFDRPAQRWPGRAHQGVHRLDRHPPAVGDGRQAVWADAPRLRAEGVDVERDMPMWTDGPEHSTMRVSTTSSTAAGLRPRPLTETVADLRAWDVARGLAPLTVGLDPERERELIRSVTGH